MVKGCDAGKVAGFLAAFQTASQLAGGQGLGLPFYYFMPFLFLTDKACNGGRLSFRRPLISAVCQRCEPFELPYGFLPGFGGLELHFAVIEALDDLGGVGLGEFDAAFCVTQDVVDAQAAFVFGYGHLYADFLAEAGRADVFEVELHHGPGMALFEHDGVVVADFVKEGAAGDFEVFDIVAVPDDLHHVYVEKGDFDFGVVAAVDVFSHVGCCSRSRRS